MARDWEISPFFIRMLFGQQLNAAADNVNIGVGVSQLLLQPLPLRFTKYIARRVGYVSFTLFFQRVAEVTTVEQDHFYSLPLRSVLTHRISSFLTAERAVTRHVQKVKHQLLTFFSTRIFLAAVVYPVIMIVPHTNYRCRLAKLLINRVRLLLVILGFQDGYVFRITVDIVAKPNPHIRFLGHNIVPEGLWTSLVAARTKSNGCHDRPLCRSRCLRCGDRTGLL